MQRHCLFLGALIAGIAVATGAFGAHGLEGFLEDKHAGDVELIAKRIGDWKTAALYQMHHAIGICLLGIVALIRPNRWLTIASICFLAGILLFSGMLYLLVLTEIQIHWAFIPLGGLSLIMGWILFAIGAHGVSKTTLSN